MRSAPACSGVSVSILELAAESRGSVRVGARFEAAEHPAFVKGACARIVAVDKTELAVFGEVAPALTKGMRLKTPLFLALVELEALALFQPPVAKYQPLPQYPATSRDVAMIVPDTLSCGEIVAAVRAEKCAFLENVELFDIFADEKALGPGKKSLAFSLTYRRADRTLTDDEATGAHEAIKAALAKKLGVTYR
jgi:phenylalanyl-tRNA synthetase beta chain